MSVFYNLKANANSGEDREAKFLNTGTKGAVIQKQNEYLCGVRRFKIPIANIPVWRFYHRLHKIGFSIKGGFNRAPQIFSPSQCICDFPTTAPFDRDSIKYNKDNRTVDVFGDGNTGFVSCESQDEICGELNRTLSSCLSYMGDITSIRTNHTIFGASGKTVGNGDYGVQDYQTILVGYQFAAQGRNLAQNPTNILSSLEIQLTAFSMTGAVEYQDLSKFNFYVKKYKIGEGPKTSNATHQIKDDSTGNLFFNSSGVPGHIVKGVPVATYPMIISTFKGVSSLSGTKIVVSSGNATENNNSRNECFFDAQKCDSSFVGETTGFTGTTTATDLPAIMGTKADGFNWFLIAENKTYLEYGSIPVNGNISNNDIVFPVSEILAPTLKIGSIPIQANQNELPAYLGIEFDPNNVGNSLQDETQYLFPYFKYNEDNKKICLQLSEFWNNRMCFKLYMNTALDSMLQFSNYRENVVNERNQTEYIATPMNVIDGVKEFKYLQNIDGGYIYSFNTPFFKREVGEINTGINKFSVVEYYERNSGNFARDLLNSIKVFTSSIAVVGEAVGDGDNVERVLTDFVLDTSVVGRDYLVYTPQGGIRYYELDSPSPLRRVDASIFFEDIYGISRPLFIPAGMECSLKLEFRPINMVYNFMGM